MSTPFPGMDMASLQSLMQQFGPTEEDKRQARAMAAIQMAAGLLGTRRGQEGAGIGNAVSGGLLGYRQGLQDVTKERQQGLMTAGTLQDMLRRNQYAAQLAPDAAPQAAPQQPPAGIPQGNGVTTYPLPPAGGASPMPPSTPPQQQQGGIYAQLRAMGVPDLAIRNASMSRDPAAAVNDLIKEYDKPFFGQGKTPIVRDGNGGFRVSVPAGFNDALAAQTTAETAASEGVKAGYDFVDVPVGNGQTRKMSKADAAVFLKGQQPSPAPASGGPRFDFKGLTLEQATQALEEAKRSAAPAAGMGGPGVTASPLAMKAGEARIETDAGKERGGYNTMLQNSQTMYEDIRKNFFAAKAAKNHAENMEKNDKGEVFSGPGGAIGANAANWFNSLIPGANISGDKLANTQYAEAEISRMQQSLGKAFPGQQSNYELTTVTNSLPTLIKTKEGRARIYAAIKQAGALEEANYKSASDHMRANNGNLVGWMPSDMPPIEQFAPPAPPAKRIKLDQFGRVQ